MKKVLLTCIAVLIVTASFYPAFGQQSARGFDTPTQCAEAVFAALQKQDMDAVEECFAIPEMARLFDFRKFCERLNAVPGHYPYLPSTSGTGIAYNEAQIRTALYRQLAFSSVMLADNEFGEQINSFVTKAPLNDETYALISFLEAPSSMQGFSRFSLEFVVTPALLPELSEIYYSEKNTQNRDKQMAMWNVEEHVELIIVAKMNDDMLGGDRLLIPLRFVRVGGKWLADPTGSNVRSILGINSSIIISLLSAIQ